MEPNSADALARIWADATPLSKYLEQRARQLPIVAQTKSNPSHGDRQSPIENLAKMLDAQRIWSQALDKATVNVLNDLVAGRIVGLARPAESYSIVAIDPSFWIGAKPQGDWATQNGKKFIDIRITAPATIPAIRTRLQPGPGRPSKREVIVAVIAEYAKDDPGLDQPRRERYRRYRALIASQGFDPDDPGFDGKTVEKYETEHRKKFK